MGMEQKPKVRKGSGGPYGVNELYVANPNPCLM